MGGLIQTGERRIYRDSFRALQGFLRVASIASRPPSGGSWVYIFKTLNAPYIKIGRAKSVERRMIAGQTFCPFELIELARADEAILSEAYIHRLFKPDRIRGEWFRETAELLKFAEELKALATEGIEEREDRHACNSED